MATNYRQAVLQALDSLEHAIATEQNSTADELEFNAILTDKRASEVMQVLIAVSLGASNPVVNHAASAAWNTAENGAQDRYIDPSSSPEEGLNSLRDGINTIKALLPLFRF